MRNDEHEQKNCTFINWTQIYRDAEEMSPEKCPQKIVFHYPHSTGIFRKYCKNIPWKGC